MNRTLDAKFALMQGRLREMGAVAVAFSAGVDSTFVLKVVRDVLGPENVVAVTARSPSLPADDLAEARRLAQSFGVRHVIVDSEEFSDSNYTSNPTDRCYYCKTALYLHMRRLVAEEGIKWILSGTNADDLGDWRPGLRAAAEHRIAAPVAEAGLAKEDVRVLSARMGLSTSDKPASPCLSSRIPYGQAVTPEKLRAVEEGEKYLKREFGLRECRVRHYGDFARIEVPASFVEGISAPRNQGRLDAFFHALGFGRVEVDPRGFRSGSLNEVIAFGKRQDSP